MESYLFSFQMMQKSQLTIMTGFVLQGHTYVKSDWIHADWIMPSVSVAPALSIL